VTRDHRYCTTECQRIDWRDRGHRKACKTIRNERAAEAARAEAPTLPPSPPKEIFYGPAPRSHADEIRARIAAEHEAARALREANPEPEPTSARFGGRCPICMEKWDVNNKAMLRGCCCQKICVSCADKFDQKPCPLCRAPFPRSHADILAQIRRHVDNDVPEAIKTLGDYYFFGHMGLVKSAKKAAKLWKRGVELENVDSMVNLAHLYQQGDGVKLDLRKALQLMRIAAERGDANAQQRTGILLHPLGHSGLGTPHEAFRYYKMSADQGHKLATYFVGVAYRRGEGVDQDEEEACRWWERGAALGDEGSRQMLANLRAQMPP